MKQEFPSMGMAEQENGSRRQAIASALGGELQRQAGTGASRIDVQALAEAVEKALAPSQPLSEGTKPSALNAGNDG